MRCTIRSLPWNTVICSQSSRSELLGSNSFSTLTLSLTNTYNTIIYWPLDLGRRHLIEANLRIESFSIVKAHFEELSFIDHRGTLNYCILRGWLYRHLFYLFGEFTVTWFDEHVFILIYHVFTEIISFIYKTEVVKWKN